MKKSAISNPELRIESWPQADAAMERCASKQTYLAIERALMDKEILAITEKYSELIGNAELVLAATQQALDAFTTAHKSEFKASPDGDGRSYEHAGVVIGFRQHPDKVGLPRGDAKKAVTLEYLAQYRPEFVRRTPEFDLVKLLAALKDGDAVLVQALEDHDIKLKPGRDEFFLKIG